MPIEIDPHAWPLVASGLLLLAGYAAHALGQRAHIPRVTLLLLLGVLAGPSALNLISDSQHQWLPVISETTLSLVGFMLGERFVTKQLHKSGKLVLLITLFETLGAAIAVFALLMLVGTPLPMALLLAGIAPASAPAATVDVVRESGARGNLSETVLAVVAIDDAFGIILFSFALAAAEMLAGQGFSGASVALAVWEVGGGLALGVALGFPMAWLTGRVQPGELTLVETLGFVLLCGGLAVSLHVSYLLACIALGAVVANRAAHHKRPFHAIKGISQPFLIVFFVLAGLSFDLATFQTLGLVSGAYVVARAVGLILGSTVGASVARAPHRIKAYVGFCLLPQAGVALGLGLLAAERFPEYGAGLLSLLLGTTFVFEVVGPIAARISLRMAGEARSASARSPSKP